MLAHVVAQALTFFRLHAAPAPTVIARAAFLTPVLAHLLAQLAAVLRCKITPPVARQRPGRGSKQDYEQERQDNAGFHGGDRGRSMGLIVRRDR